MLEHQGHPAAGSARTDAARTRIRSASPPAASGTASSVPTTSARPPSAWTTSTATRSTGQTVYVRRSDMRSACAAWRELAIHRDEPHRPARPAQLSPRARTRESADVEQTPVASRVGWGVVGMAGARGVRRLVRWGLRHGVPRAVMARRARAGDLGARIMFDTAVRAEPFPFYEQLRARGRLVDAGVTRCSVDHGLCSAVLRSPDFGSPVPTEGLLPLPVRLARRVAGRGSLSAAEPPSMLVADPPEHTRYRRLVTRAFSARAVAALRARTEEIAEELLDAMAARGPRVDLVRDYAVLLPLTVIAEVLGAPRSMREQFLGWSADTIPLIDFGIPYRDFRRGELAIDALHAWTLQHFEVLRRDPGDNILSTLVAARDGSDGLTDDELSSMAMLLLEAGFETTVNLIGNGVALLTRNPDQLDALRDAPATLAGRGGRGAALRLAGPAHGPAGSPDRRDRRRTRAGRRGRHRPARRREPRPRCVHRPAALRRHPGRCREAPGVLGRHPLLRRGGAGEDGGRGRAARAVRPVPGPGAHRATAPPAEPRPAGLRHDAGHSQPGRVPA